MDGPDGRDQTAEFRQDDGRVEVHRVPIDPAGQATVAEAVVAGVADAAEVDPRSLPMLHDVVDPEALDRLIASVEGGLAEDRVVVEFPYCGYHVTVRPREVRLLLGE